MDIAHEWQEQQLIEREELAAENALRERALAAGFTDLHGGIEDHGAGLRGRLPGHQNAIFVKEYFRENRDSVINRAMAEVAGWTQMGSISKWKSPDGRVHENWGGEMACPKFLTDLNAVHEVENTLTEDQHYSYASELAKVCNDDFHNNRTWYHLATARQRCEAILKTLNRWNPEWDR